MNDMQADIDNIGAETPETALKKRVECVDAHRRDVS